MKIFVIIVTYNGQKWIDKCVGGLRSSSIPVTPIVVDNNSSDDTLEYIENNYPEAIIISCNTNLGFGSANNLGIKKALDLECDFVFLLNQDAYLHDDALEKMIPVAKTSKAYAILSPIHLNEEKEIDHKFSNHLPEGMCPGFIYDLLHAQLKEVYAINYINAAGWLMSKNTLKAIGGFDPLFFMYGEDSEYIRRVHYKGYKLGIVPSAKLTHYRHNVYYNKIPFSKQVTLKLRRAIQQTKNVNYPLMTNIKTALDTFYESIILSLFNFKLIELLVLLIAFFQWLGLLRKIKKHRDMSFQNNYTFLN